MKKLMFNDKYGLTKAVLEGRKTMTRRIVPDGTPLGNWEETEKMSRFKVGEVVAVAQSLRDMGYDPRDTKHKSGAICGLDHTPAWINKMFVSASECIHHIRITGVRMERLQGISDEDCMREGIMEGEFMNTWDTFYYDKWGEVPNHITFKSPRKAFAALIDKVSGKGTWQSNPLVFVYQFELVK